MAIDTFQALLRELFQFDCADLDFGIYRIMNYKRDVIERFITKDLPQAVAEELDRGALADQSQANKELKELEQQIRGIDAHAIDADGNLTDAIKKLDIGKKYLGLKEKAAGGRGREALEAAIYNHLYAFFSRYYQDGDFISKRRYSKRQRYAIPYNGEEVYLYWANNDQYYVKTAEHFHDYSFTSRGVTVHFKLKAADIEQNNVKGDKRFFLPRAKEIALSACGDAQAGRDEKESQLVIPFEYRPLTEQEEITYGKKNQQEAIIAAALAEIPKRLSPKNAAQALAGLTAEKRKTAEGESVSFLEYHLRQYTKKNTSDFFIHKDLKGFLSRELDFYLKNEVLNLDEMETAGEDRAEGSRIIEFLDQIESFQKMLWEKRKFITETQYCITVGNIDEGFYPDIASCEPQWAEWKELFHIDDLLAVPDAAQAGEETNLPARRSSSGGGFNSGKNKKDKRLAFLKGHPTLVLDTKHFDAAFVDKLLASIDDLDGKTDGLLIHGENFQALNLLLDKYCGQVQCIHIDPPYNTQTSGFLYKNDYLHSSWLAMMENRIVAGISLLQAEGSFLCHIDENEYERLHVLFERVGIPNAGTVVWDKRNPMTAGRGVATQHEYVIWRSATDKAINLRSTNIRLMLNKAEELIRERGGVTEKAKKEFADWVRKHSALSGGEKAYCYLDNKGRIYQSVSLRAPEPRTDPKFFKPLIHPVTGKPCAVPPNGFSRTPETLQSMIEHGEIIFGPDETTQPRQKYFLSENTRRQISSVIQDAKRGKTDLDALGLENFPYCHSVFFYMELLGAAASESHDIILDHFAGTGTTGHAVINLNRGDEGERRFILVEMGEYFNTVLLPRIKKATFTPEWKDGKPKRMATQEEAERGPRIVKYMRLESYEDTLNNIEFDDASGQRALEFDDYLLKYMLKWETRGSETLLNVEKLARPFCYKLHIHADCQTREKIADVPETFNYLLGLHVQTRKVYYDEDRRYLVYRGRIDHLPAPRLRQAGRQLVVIWRETEGWQKEDLERDKKFVAEQKLTEGADEVFVNGDSFIPNARAIEPVFKARMFAPAEA